MIRLEYDLLHGKGFFSTASYTLQVTLSDTGTLDYIFLKCVNENLHYFEPNFIP